MIAPVSVLLFFIDGLGIGTRGPHNPFDGLDDAAPLGIFQDESPLLAGIDEITFANTYSEKFFQERPRWISATTAAVEAAGLRFNRLDDLRAGRAVFMYFTNAMLIERGESVDLRTPEEAGEVLAGIVAANKFTLYEYFITDKIGNPVPTIVWGEHREEIAARIHSLADITPGIVDVLTRGTRDDAR